MIGAVKAAMAFTNWPKVRAEDRRLSLTMLDSRGLSDTCMTALLMPSSEKDIRISGRL